MKFNEKLVELRKRQGLSQEQLGMELQVSRQTVSKWEAGQSYPDFQRLVLLSDYFGMSLDELVQWVNDHRQKVCHWFTVDTFEHLKHGGRVSGAAAMMGTLLQIKPMLHVSMEGKLDVAEKPRGAKRALAAQLARMKKGWTPEEGKLIVVGHGDCIDRAQELAEQVKTLYPDTEIYIAPIGPIIGSHTGPGMLALIFWGTER